ncbi:MAG TPA: heme exporter protein CcmD [Coxiellaceae bacterium]|nr:heme exporter protein CcmD [Coxiellaceae bacterium]
MFGQYTAYIWSAFGIALGLLMFALIHVIHQFSSIKKQLKTNHANKT